MYPFNPTCSLSTTRSNTNRLCNKGVIQYNSNSCGNMSK